jgi:hypothetical protein
MVRAKVTRADAYDLWAAPASGLTARREVRRATP